MTYEPRYLGGILFFNDKDFFQAHEVWESIWMECGGPERKFYQGLIQAAVALYHFGNGNLRGAVKLYHSSRKYLETYHPLYFGLDLGSFRRQMDLCFAEVLADTNLDRRVSVNEEVIPVIQLEPPPDHWPDPSEFEDAED